MVSPRFTMKKMFIWLLVLIILGTTYSIAGMFYFEGITKVSAITEDTNGRHIEVSGTVIDISYYPEKYQRYGSMSVTLRDSTGIIKASLTKDIVKGFAEDGNFPVLGKKMTVGGMYYGQGTVEDVVNGEKVLRADGTLKVINYDMVSLDEPKPIYASPGKIRTASSSAYNTGDWVCVSGRVVDAVYNASYGYAVDINGGSKNLKAIIPPYIYELSRGEPPKVGDMVNVSGGLEWYEYYYKGEFYGYWEMQTDYNSIKVTGKAHYVNYTLEDLAANIKEHEGELVHISGVNITHVTWKQSSSGENYSKSFDIGNEQYSIHVYIEDWNMRLSSLPANATVDIKGVVQNYNSHGKKIWEIVIRKGTNDSIEVKGARTWT